MGRIAGITVVLLVVVASMSRVTHAQGVCGSSEVSTCAGTAACSATSATDPLGGPLVISSNATGAKAVAATDCWGGNLYASAAETDGSNPEAAATLLFSNGVQYPICPSPFLDASGQHWTCGYTAIFHIFAHSSGSPNAITNLGDASGYGWIVYETALDESGTQIALTGSNQNYDISVPLVAYPAEGIQSQSLGFEAEVAAIAGALGGQGSSTLDYSHTFGATVDVYDATGNLIGSFGPPTSPYKAFVQQPINADGSSVFKANRGVIPVKFALTNNSMPTCDLPAATISVTRTSGGVVGSVDESTYTMAADNGSNFRIDPSGCQYVYNLGASSLGVGVYRVDININGIVVGSAVFALH